MTRCALLVVVAFLVAGRAEAQTCLVSTSGMNFGVYNSSLAAPTDTTATVSVSCSTVLAGGVGYSIALSAGSGGSITSRSLAGPGGRLHYQLYTSAARTLIWGDGTSGSITVNDSYSLGPLGSITRTYAAYGRIPTKQSVIAGLYSDLITVLVTY